jgi:hypothetical protein
MNEMAHGALSARIKTHDFLTVKTQAENSYAERTIICVLRALKLFPFLN